MKFKLWDFTAGLNEMNFNNPANALGLTTQYQSF